MACQSCQHEEGVCRHEMEGAVPSITWHESNPAIEALVAEISDVLRVDQQRGIVKKHLDAAYNRGFTAAVAEATNAIRTSHGLVP